jgi:hypothetical protein
MARPESSEGIGRFAISLEGMMKFETIELLQKLSNLLLVCRHAGVTAVRLPHDLVDDELRVTTNVKPLDLELSGNAYAIDEGLILRHNVGYTEV